MNWFDLPAPATPSAELNDVNAARAWLARQPQAMPAKLLAALAGQAENLAGSALPAFTLASVLETLRGATVTAHESVRRKFAFAPRPLAGDALDAFVTSTRIWHAFATGYLRCVDAFAVDVVKPPSGGADPSRIAVATHRALLTSRCLLEDYFVAGVEAPSMLWQRLQRLMQAASRLGIAEFPVADPEYRDPASTSVADQYTLAALLQLSDPYRWSAAQFTVAQRILTRWRGMARLSASSDADPKARWVPLTALAPLPNALDDRSPAWLEVHQVRRKLRKRIEALDAGESPESLHLGRELGPGACRELLDSILDHLRAAYSEPRSGLSASNAECELAVGPAGCFELLTNTPFDDTQTLNAASSRILHERLAIFGASERVDSSAPSRVAAGERWRLTGESIEMVELSRAAGAPGTRVLPGQLVVFRAPGGTPSLAIVTRAWTRETGNSEMALKRLPGKPQAMTGRSLDAAALTGAFPVFILPDVTAVGSVGSLILPTGIAPKLKGGFEARGETSLRCKLDQLVERGADFERYRFATGT